MDSARLRLAARCACGGGIGAWERRIVDGVRFVDCGERPIERLALLWPETHQVIPIREEEVS